MALIICSECGKEISDKANICIHCGCPIISAAVEIPSELPEDKIREVNGVMVNVDALVRKHGNDMAGFAKDLEFSTGVSKGKANQLAKLAYKNRGVIPRKK